MHNECIEYMWNGFEFFKWYHFCLIYEDVSIDSEELFFPSGHQTVMNLYVNGEKVKEGELYIKINNVQMLCLFFDIRR